jgi:co-chaperonin GroES (HSP10)
MIKAAPGIYIVKPLKDKSLVNLGTQKERKIIKGEIIAKGENRQHDNGGELKLTLPVGTIVYFLNYAEGYDMFEHEGQELYGVIGNDVRAYIEE